MRAPPPKAGVSTRSLTVCTVCGFTCLALVVVGIVLTTFVRDAINDYVNSQLTAKFALDSSDAADFPRWSNASYPTAAVIYTDFYVYNYTNPEGILRGERPHVQEIGPLRYRFYNDKLNCTWDPEEDGDVMEFGMYQYYIASGNETIDLEQMTITTLNMPLLGALHSPLTQGLGDIFVLIVNQAGFDVNSLFVQRSAFEVVWGWNDPLLGNLSTYHPGLPTYYPGIQGNDSSMEAAGANHQPYRMYTGKETVNLAREYILWDGLSEMQCCPYGPCGDTGTGSPPLLPWNTLEAEQIRGGFGDQFHQNVDQSETLYVSTHAYGIYRHWPLQSSSNYNYEGVNLLKFGWAPGVLGNASVDETEALAYNVNGPSGLLNQSQCEWGAEVFISKPRFFQTDPPLWKNIDGMPAPTAENDDVYLGVEPYTGTTMDFHWRVGVNVLVRPAPVAGSFPQVTFFAGVNTTFMPVAFGDRFANATDSEVQELKSQVYLGRDLILAARWGGVALAVVAMVSGVVFFVLAYRQRRALENIRAMETEKYYAELYSNRTVDLYRPMLAPDVVMPVEDGAPGAMVPSGDDVAASTAAALSTHLLAGTATATAGVVDASTLDGAAAPRVAIGGSLNVDARDQSQMTPAKTKKGGRKD